MMLRLSDKEKTVFIPVSNLHYIYVEMVTTRVYFHGQDNRWIDFDTKTFKKRVEVYRAVHRAQ